MSGRGPEVIGRGPGLPNIKFRMPTGPAKVFVPIIAVLIASFFVFNLFFVNIQPYEVGIKQVNVGVLTSRGIKEEPIGPGLAFRIPTFEMIHRFPQNVQVMDFSEPKRNQRPDPNSPGRRAKIQTSDGFFVDVDVSILYRIVDPYRVITTLGPGLLYITQGLLPKAEPILKQALGELTTEDFYNTPLRVAKAIIARDLLNEEMLDKGIEVHHVLIREFKYTDDIQRNIEEKKLQDQLVFKNQSQGRAAIEEANVKRVTQEGEMRVQVTLEQGNAYKVTKDAERDLYVRSKRAEADLLVKLAEAGRTEMRNEAMQSSGVDKAVAMKMAEVLRGLDVIVIPVGGEDGFNPLDLDQMVDLFGVIPDSKSTQAGR